MKKWKSFEGGLPVIALMEPENIQLKFPCPHCGKVFETEIISVRPPNYIADTDQESRIEQYPKIYCPNCGHDIDVLITNGFGGMYVDIEGVDQKEIFYRLVD